MLAHGNQGLLCFLHNKARLRQHSFDFFPPITESQNF